MATVTNESPGLQVPVIAVRVTALVSKTTGVTDVSAGFKRRTPRERKIERGGNQKKCERKRINQIIGGDVQINCYCSIDIA